MLLEAGRFELGLEQTAKLVAELTMVARFAPTARFAVAELIPTAALRNGLVHQNPVFQVGCKQQKVEYTGSRLVVKAKTEVAIAAGLENSKTTLRGTL